MMRSTILGGLLLLLCPFTAQAACNANFSFTFGQATSGFMTTGSGEACAASAVRTAGTTVIKSVKVVSPPKNGSASAGSNGVTYRSKPGYKGSDAFTFTIFGDGKAGTNVTATIQMSVTVQ